MNNETTTPAPDRSGPPAGYTKCPDCDRWASRKWCWQCFFARPGIKAEKWQVDAEAEPDWTPPLPAAPAPYKDGEPVSSWPAGVINAADLHKPAAPVHVAREAGQTLRSSTYGTWTLTRRVPHGLFCGQWYATSVPGGAEGILSDAQLADATLLSAPKADAAKCAFCGRVPPDGLWQAPYCSNSCRRAGTNAKSATAETLICRHGATPGMCSHCKPATAEKGPVCTMPDDVHHVRGAVRHWRDRETRELRTGYVCEHHYLFEIEPSGGGSDILHNADVPERLPAPRMAHSAQWADECEDVR